jgi:YYY domain-containing protein
MPETRSWWSNPTVWLVAIVLFAAAVRLAHIDWDQNHHYHPDERAVVSAVQRVRLWPPQLNPEFFAYGSLPIYATRVASDAAALIDRNASTYDGINLMGRRLSALFGTLTVLLLIWLGTRLYDRTVGLLAGFLLAACVLHIQNSRFLTVDVPLTFFVLLALSALVRICRDGRVTSFVLGGAAIGVAVANKFSAMPLFAPLAVAALHRYLTERRLVSVAARTGLAVLAAAGAFALAQPYALIDFPRFYRDIIEQSSMVRTAGVFPYTTQYMHTPKYLYELTQLVLWCMGPALGVVAVWASVTRPATAWRARRAEDWVLLSWVVPFFLISGWFEVKFPRYLLPIYPVMILWAADWLVRKYRSGGWLGRLAAPVVVVGTAAAALAFLATYIRPHTVVTASEWFYRHVPPGSRVLSQHWDEGFPFGLPGRNLSAYTVTDFGYYERPDGATKIRELSEELARSNYIVFQTKRLYGAVTRAPERYPKTTNFFYELFAGDLGYTLVHEVASRPALFGIEIPDELADESLTVYDHPKVLFFRNDEHLPAAVLYDKIMNGLPSRPLTRDDLLLARPTGENGVTEGGEVAPVRSSLLALVLFAGFVEALSLAMYGLLRRWCDGIGALAISKPLGLLVFAYVSWLLSSLAGASFSQGTLLAVAGVMVLAGAVLWRRPGRAPTPRPELRATEVLFWGTFAFFLTVRAYNPEIFWGEKPMDFSFLNALTRTTAMPPPEPWFAGSPLHYSYFGYFMVAAVGKALHIAPALTFNLAIAMVAALTASGAFALGAAVGQRWQTGLLTAVFITLLGNLAGPRELLGPHPRLNFDYFWATSRVIKDTINEYPVWSFLFADLHAHVMVMPISLTFICLAVLWIRARVLDPDAARPRGTTLVLLFLLALTFGSIAVTNAWSTPTYVLLFPFLVGTVWLAEGRHRGLWRLVSGAVGEVVLPTLMVIGGAYLLFYPFWTHFVPPERNFGWEQGVLARPVDFLTIWGLFLFALGPFVYVLWLREVRRDRDRLSVGGAVLCGVAALVPLAALFVSTRVFALSMFLLAFQVLLAPRTEARWRVAVGMAAFAFAITAGCDLVYVWDRMNTLFKFYLEAWFLMSAAAAVAVQAIWSGAVPTGRWRRAWQAGLVVLVSVGLFTTVTDTVGVLRTNRVPTPKPTLDGMAYLRLRAPEDLAAYEWLNRNIRGIPTILEAHGDSYQEFTRVAMNTGLPTVLGWSYHVYQRSHPWNEINRRKADIQEVYTSDNEAAVAAILERYHVSLVYVGGLERRTYAGGNLQRFTEWTDLLTPVYQNPGVTIFAVKGRFAGAMPVTTIEELPEAAGAAEEEAPPAPEAPGVVRQPRGVAVTPTGDVVVCDFGNNRLQEFARDLKFFGPRGVTVDAGGRVFVSDTGNHRVVRFSAAGMKELEWGGKGTEPGKFSEPVGIFADAGGKIYVADNGNGRLQVFTPDGRFVSQFPVKGWTSKVYSEPSIVLDADGLIWVTVPLEKQVRAYDASGRLVRTIDGSTVPGAAFVTPMGIGYDRGARHLVISDLENRLVRLPITAGR